MRVQISFASWEAAAKKLREMAEEVEKNDAAQHPFILEEGRGDPVFELEIVNENNDEFEEPSATVLR